MPLSTYAELLADVPKWANRSDAAFSAMVPSFVRLAEARIQSDLPSPMLEKDQDVTVTSGVAQLPDNVLSVIGLRVNAARRPDATITSQRRLEEYKQALYTGLDILACIVGRQVRTVGVANGATLTVRAKCAIPDLATNSTNRVLTLWPDLYLRATMHEAMLYLRDDAGADVWLGRYQQSLGQVTGTPAVASGGGRV